MGETTTVAEFMSIQVDWDITNRPSIRLISNLVQLSNPATSSNLWFVRNLKSRNKILFSYKLLQFVDTSTNLQADVQHNIGDTTSLEKTMRSLVLF
ncbi:hypothetical protein SUGI_0988380 [Cryptomeria japonica]|nr:hypothetical protein SUGI_0988380 [Cryptomeria japonica]